MNLVKVRKDEDPPGYTLNFNATTQIDLHIPAGEDLTNFLTQFSVEDLKAAIEKKGE